MPSRHLNVAVPNHLYGHDAETVREAAMSATDSVWPSPSTTVPMIARTIVTTRGSRALRCPDCHSPLNLLQPDENNPARLLGICDSCGKWTILFELEPMWRKTVLVELPDEESVHREID